jgi:hypothetical protein
MFDNLTEFNGNASATNESVLRFEESIGSKMPEDYLAFLKRFNGGEGYIGDDAYVILWSTDEIICFNREYEVSENCPELLLIGSNGAGEAYAFDRRSKPWHVVQVPFVGMESSLCDDMGRTFSEFIERLARKDSDGWAV